MEACSIAQNNFEVFIAADKFDIPSLKSLTKACLNNRMEKSPEKLLNVVRDIWANIPPVEIELRDAIISKISYHADGFVNHDEGIRILKAMPELAIAVLKETVNENTRLKRK